MVRQLLVRLGHVPGTVWEDGVRFEAEKEERLGVIQKAVEQSRRVSTNRERWVAPGHALEQRGGRRLPALAPPPPSP